MCVIENFSVASVVNITLSCCAKTEGTRKCTKAIKQCNIIFVITKEETNEKV
jgi:hypothetical protein